MTNPLQHESGKLAGRGECERTAERNGTGREAEPGELVFVIAPPAPIESHHACAAAHEMRPHEEREESNETTSCGNGHVMDGRFLVEERPFPRRWAARVLVIDDIWQRRFGANPRAHLSRNSPHCVVSRFIHPGAVAHGNSVEHREPRSCPTNLGVGSPW